MTQETQDQTIVIKEAVQTLVPSHYESGWDKYAVRKIKDNKYALVAYYLGWTLFCYLTPFQAKRLVNKSNKLKLKGDKKNGKGAKQRHQKNAAEKS